VGREVWTVYYLIIYEIVFGLVCMVWMFGAALLAIKMAENLPRTKSGGLFFISIYVCIPLKTRCLVGDENCQEPAKNDVEDAV
jgi:hypothetical protein